VAYLLQGRIFLVGDIFFMGIIRIKKTKNYSVISNQIASDPNISWGAKGLLFYLLTRPDNWQTKITSKNSLN